MSVDISKFTKKQIVEMSNRIAPIANAKLKEMRELGYDKLNNSMIRKYNVLTSYKANKNMVTQKGYFRKGGASKYTKEQLIKRYEIMNDFINNDFASVAYTQRHLQKMREKYSLTDDEIKTMFEAYREYGYNNYSDSEGTLQAFSKIMNDSSTLDEPMDSGDYLRQVLEDIADDLDNQGRTEEDYIRELKSSANILPD